MRFLIAAALIVGVWNVQAQDGKDKLIPIIEAELDREIEHFKTATLPPYFISYRVNDVQSAYLTSSFGSLVSTNMQRNRYLVTDVRVGDYAFDNSHPFSTFDEVDMPRTNPQDGFNTPLPLDDDRGPVSLTLWQQTQAKYRTALATYKALMNSPKITSANVVADFSKEEPVVSIDPAAPQLESYFDRQVWEARLRSLTAPFAENVSIVRGNASLQLEIERKYVITSEGTRIAQNRTSAYLSIEGSILAEDGDIVPLHLSYFSRDPGGLPSEEVILSDVRKLIEKLNLLRSAPLADPYTGPAILQARAAGVFFHEIFGHRVEGHRLKSEEDGQTFKNKIGQLVLPKSFSIVFDPTVSTMDGKDLNGHYRYDDEGVKARMVRVVENGVLKHFLMSRTPLESHSQSNGHGRAQAGNKVVSRQSNLIVENRKPVKTSDLRKMLLSECRKQKKPYGYLFMDVMGGFTTTGRFMPNAFNIFPTEVYRIYADGRPDELVRGVDLIGTPLAMFAEIAAADDSRDIFTGFCGAESGSVPVTAIAPSFFVKRIETQKKNTHQLEKALLERPSVANTPGQLKPN